MNYTKEMFQRSTIRGLAEYVLYGAPATKGNNGYEERMTYAYQQFDKQAKKYAKKRASKISDSVNQLVCETSDVYTEIGLQAGLLIMMDMFKNAGFSADVRKEETPKIDFAEMYDSLFRDVSVALQLLQKHEDDSIEKVEKILKSAQRATEDIYISSGTE